MLCCVTLPFSLSFSSVLCFISFCYSFLFLSLSDGADQHFILDRCSSCIIHLHFAGEIQRHLQSMLYLLRPEDKIKLVGTDAATVMLIGTVLSIYEGL